MNNIMVCFLDIDGVLNYPGDNDLLEGFISKERILIYKKLVDKYKFFTIINSSRRLNDIDRISIDKIFNEYNISFDYLSINYTGLSRGCEIIKFIECNNIKGFVILDDNTYDYLEHSITKYKYVNIDKGLNIDILNRLFKN